MGDLMDLLKDNPDGIVEFSEDNLEELIGEQVLNKKEWVNLCPLYPNTKGITCDEIYEFKQRVYPKELLSIRKKLRNIVKTHNEESKNAIEQDNPGEFWYGDSIGKQLRKEFYDTLGNAISDKELNHIKRELVESNYNPNDISNVFRAIYDTDWFYDQTSQYRREEIDQFLNELYFLSRDEIYGMSIELGKRLNNGYDVELLGYKRYLKDNGVYSDKLKKITREDMENDKMWAKYTHKKQKIKKATEELGIRDYLHDENTIFITTPRGGHEFLSIFAYANDIKKENIPSLIDKEENNSNFIGKTWLGNHIEDIDTVVIVDDIIESGKQLRDTIRTINDVFEIDKGENKINIKSISLCGRDKNNVYHILKNYHINKETGLLKELYDIPNDDEHKKMKESEEWVNIYDNAIYGKEIVDKSKFVNKDRGMVSCVFPWAYSDSQIVKPLDKLFRSRNLGGRTGVDRDV